MEDHVRREAAKDGLLPLQRLDTSLLRLRLCLLPEVWSEDGCERRISVNRPINEDDVKRMLRRYKRNWRYGSELSVGHVCLLAIEDVEAMPTLDVTPTVHAKYGFIGPYVGCFVGDFLYGTCSACHERVLYTHKHNSFCPNCGAKMEADHD